MDAHYLGFFECFNQQLFFEAHDVLEELWLRERGGPRDLFYKGLIQLAGAFVHLQKNRIQPAGALFRLSRANLGQYPAVFEQLELTVVQALIAEWLRGLEGADGPQNPLAEGNSPKLALRSA